MREILVEQAMKLERNKEITQIHFSRDSIPDLSPIHGENLTNTLVKRH